MHTAQVVPLPLPDWLVETYGLDLQAAPSDGWSFIHHDVTFAPSGDMYTLSDDTPSPGHLHWL